MQTALRAAARLERDVSAPGVGVLMSFDREAFRLAWLEAVTRTSR